MYKTVFFCELMTDFSSFRSKSSYTSCRFYNTIILATFDNFFCLVSSFFSFKFDIKQLKIHFFRNNKFVQDMDSFFHGKIFWGKYFYETFFGGKSFERRGNREVLFHFSSHFQFAGL